MPAQIIHKQTIDLTRCPLFMALETPLSTYDDGADVFLLRCIRDGESALQEGDGVQAYFRHGNNTTILIPGTIEGDRAKVVLPAACYDTPGSFTLSVKVTSGDNVTTIYRCDGYVLASRTEKISDPEHLVPSLDELMPVIQQVQESLATYQQTRDTIISETLGKVALPFEATGNPVTCYPVEGSPLSVTMEINPHQDGEPSKDNPATITLGAGIVTANGTAYTPTLPAGFVGGTVSLAPDGCTATKSRKQITLTGTESWSLVTSAGLNQLYILVADAKRGSHEVNALCSHYRGISIDDRINNYDTAFTGTGSICFNIQGTTVANWKTYLQAQAAAGTPVVVNYVASSPETVEIPALSIPGKGGENTITADADSLTVSGYENPRHTIAELKTALITIGGMSNV